jgi:hypothetical protein
MFFRINMAQPKHNLFVAVTALFHFLIGIVFYIPAAMLGVFYLFDDRPSYSWEAQVQGNWFAFIIFSLVVLIFRYNYKSEQTKYTMYWGILYLTCLACEITMTILTIQGNW